MKVGIMQPYFLPYIGYFQLIAAVDVFVVYDNIQYTKKGWINRNRMLQNGADAVFSLPLRKGSDYLDVRDRTLADTFDRAKLLSQFGGNYRRAPYFDETMPLLKRVIGHADDNLFGYVHHSIAETCAHFGITTKIKISSDIDIDHSLRGQDKVIALTRAVGGTTYINTIGGVEMYSKSDFAEHGVTLQFIKSLPIEYEQFGEPFVPWLSITDVMMFNETGDIREAFLNKVEVV